MLLVSLLRAYPSLPEMTEGYLDELINGPLREFRFPHCQRYPSTELIDYATSAFKLYAALETQSGHDLNLADFIDEKIDEYFCSYYDRMSDLLGNLAYMEISNRLAGENFLGMDWTEYNPEAKLEAQLKEIVGDTNYYTHESMQLKAQVLSENAQVTLGGRAELLAEGMVREAVYDFTREYVWFEDIISHKGDYILRLIRLFNIEPSVKNYVLQPYTLDALAEALERNEENIRGMKFAKQIVRQLTGRDIRDLSILKPRFEEVIKAGFVYDANQCNTSEAELKRISDTTKYIEDIRRVEGLKDHLFLGLGDKYAAVHDGSKWHWFLYNGNPATLLCEPPGLESWLHARFCSSMNSELKVVVKPMTQAVHSKTELTPDKLICAHFLQPPEEDYNL